MEIVPDVAGRTHVTRDYILIQQVRSVQETVSSSTRTERGVRGGRRATLSRVCCKADCVGGSGSAK